MGNGGEKRHTDLKCAFHWQSHPTTDIDLASRRSQASFVVHGRLCRDHWKMEFQVVRAAVISAKTDHKNTHSTASSEFRKPRCLHAIQHCKRAIYWWWRLALYRLSWSQLRLLSTEESSLQTQSLWPFCSPRTSTLTLPLSWLNLLHLLL